MTITAKGEQRRALLVAAVLPVLERSGVGGVTHRAVAAEAGLPLASATYYFDSIDDLLITALRSATDSQVAWLERLQGADVRVLARLLHRLAHTDRASAIAQYELLFAAMRRDALRADAERWYAALAGLLARFVADDGARRSASYAVDGLMLRMLWTGQPSTVAATERELRAIVGASAAT